MVINYRIATKEARPVKVRVNGEVKTATSELQKRDDHAPLRLVGAGFVGGSCDRVGRRLTARVPHRNYVFAIPIMVRAYFRDDRSLLHDLCAAAEQGLRDYLRAILHALDGIPAVTIDGGGLRAYVPYRLQIGEKELTGKAPLRAAGVKDRSFRRARSPSRRPASIPWLCARGQTKTGADYSCSMSH